MDAHEIRAGSVRMLECRGIDSPSSLPVLSEDELRVQRSTDEIINRVMCLSAAAAVAHGLKRESALAWLTQEELLDSLDEAEAAFVRRGRGEPELFMSQVESVNALAWALGLVSTLDPWRPAPEDLVSRLPDMKMMERCDDLRSSAALRPDWDVARELDLLYCLHWIVVDCRIHDRKTPAGLVPYRVVTRRQALEWLVCKERWEDVFMDT